MGNFMTGRKAAYIGRQGHTVERAEQATMQELFLPYLIDGTQTLHERVLTSGTIPELQKGEV